MPGGEKHDREDIWQFVWRGERYNVENGTQMLTSLCDLLRIEKPERFEILPEDFPVSRRRWFARDKSGMARPHRFHNSNVYLETNMSSATKKVFAKELLRFFRFPTEDIQFKSAKRTKP